MKKVAGTIKDHWQGVLNAFDSKLTNGRVGAANAGIQAAKAKARGLRHHQAPRHLAFLVARKLLHLPVSPFRAKPAT